METISSTQTSAPLALSTDGMPGGSSNPMGLRQTDAQPTQRSSHSLINFFKNKFGRSSDRNLVQVNAQPSQQVRAPNLGINNRPAIGNSNTSQTQQNMAVNNLPAIVRLGDAGKPEFLGFKAEGVSALLKSALGQPSQNYQDATSAENQQDHMLLDRKGNVLHVRHTPTALIALSSSQTEQASDPFGQKLRMTQQDDSISVHTINELQQGIMARPALETIGHAHEGHITGVHQGKDGVALRLHQGELYTLNPTSDAWEKVDTGEMKFSQLAVQGNGKIFAKDRDSLVDLASPNAPSVAINELKAFAVNPSSHAATLSGDHAQHLDVFDFNPSIPVYVGSKTLELNGGNAEAKSIGFSHEKVFISDTEGRLYSAGYKDLNSDSPDLKLMPLNNFQHGGQSLGGDSQVSGFLSGNNGNLHALITDRNGQTHSHALDEPNQRLGGGWNVSDVAAITNTHGLPPDKSIPQFNTVNLGHLGTVGFDGGEIKRWDATSQAWKETGIKDVSQLIRGMDGKAYVIHEGAVKKLDVKAVHPQFIMGANHALKQPSSSTEVKLGEKLPGGNGTPVKACAVYNSKEFVTVDHNGIVTAHHKKGEPTKFDKLNFEVGYLAIGADGTLYAKSANGELQMMHKDNWQADQDQSRHDAPWTPAQTPNNRPLESIRTGDDNSLVAKFSGSAADEPLIHVQAKHWKQLPASYPADQKGPDLFKDLNNAQSVKRIPHTGATMQISTDVMGRGSTGGTVTSTRRQFAHAHVRPTQLASIPDHIHHRLTGRKGMTELYEKDRQAVHNLPSLAPQSIATDNMASRIQLIDRLGPQGANLKNELDVFRGEVEGSILRGVQNLGESKNKGSSHLDRIRAHTDKSDKHNFLQSVKMSLDHLPPSAENPALQATQELLDKGVKISQPKEHPVRHRDRSDPQALTKTRLLVDLETLRNLNPLLDNAANVQPGPGADDAIKALEKDLRLQQKDYSNNVVTAATNAGLRNYKEAEAHYDANKTFSKGLNDPKSAISTNLSSALGTKNKEDTKESFIAELKSLEPGTSITMKYGRGETLSTPFVAIVSMVMGPWPNASIGHSHNYSLTTARGEDGITFTVQNERTGTASAGVGMGRNVLPDILNQQAGGVNIGNRTLMPEVRVGANLTAAASDTSRKSISFTVPNEEIDQFGEKLFSGKLNMLDTVKTYTNPATQHDHLTNVAVSAGLSAEVRAGLPLSEPGSAPLASGARVALGGSVSANMLEYNRQTSEKRTANSETHQHSDNRIRGFNSLAFSATAGGTVTGGHSSNNTSQGIGVSLGAGITAKVDNKTAKMASVTFKKAEPLTADNLSTLSKTLGAAFKDPRTQEALVRLENDPNYANLTPKEQASTHLAGLIQHFSNTTPINDQQHAAIRELNNSSTQQTLSAGQGRLLDGASFETAHTNLNRLDHQGAISKLMSTINPGHKTSNAEHLSKMLESTPQLRAVFAQLKNSPGTSASVQLELKDDVKDRINQGLRDKSISRQDIDHMVSDRNNMRIKSITVSHTVAKQESFTSPTPVLGYNSSATLSETKTLGKINFAYDRDGITPKTFSVEGDISKPTAAT